MFPEDSPLIEAEDRREADVIPFYTVAEVFVNRPGNLSDPVQRHKLDQMVKEMESLPYAYGRKSTHFILRDYEDYLAQLEARSSGYAHGAANTSLDMSQLGAFLDWPEDSWWKAMVKWHTEGGTTVLDSILITVGYHGADLKSWSKRAEVLTTWRRVLDKYSDEFNVTVFHDDGLYLDFLENMPTDIWQSATATLVCMAAMCALFMVPNFAAIGVTTCVIASILISALGIMALQGMTMDPIVMAAMIISMGFSVDVPAHVSFRYHSAGKV
ncbi:CRE-PTR-12 protein [Aphelenchoides avenae]|nr:CRE-PTR-12 protein [Aphelenchus avenae]